MARKNGFVTKPVLSAQTVGERLQSVRHAKGYSVEEIVRRTGVRRGYILAIEEGRFEELPAPVYSAGFVKKYAHTLHLPAAELERAFRQEYAFLQQLEDQRSAYMVEREGELPSETARKARSARQWVQLIAGVCIVLVLAAYIALQAIWLSAPPTLIVVDPSTDVRVQDTSYMIVGSVEEGSQLVLNGESVPVASDGTFRIEVPLQQGENRLEFQARNSAGKTTEVERVLFANPPAPASEPESTSSQE